MAAIQTVQSVVKCKSLWNGSTNIVPGPGDWAATSYDDSGWSASAAVSAVRTPLKIYVPALFTSFPFPSGTEPVWPETSSASAYEMAAFRWHITLPAGFDVTEFDFIGPGDVASDTLYFWVNGAAPFSPGTLNNYGLTVAAFNTAFKSVATPGDNVIAFLQTGSHQTDSLLRTAGTDIGSSLHYGPIGSDPWIAFYLTVTGGLGPRAFGTIVGD